MKVTNKYGLPDAFVQAVSVERHNKAGCYSATTLNKGVKEIILQARHWDELETDASDNVWAIFGSALHSVMQSKAETFLMPLFRSFIAGLDDEDEDGHKRFAEKMIEYIKFRAAIDAFVEESFSENVSNSVVTGQIDSYNIDSGTIVDWKTSSVYKVLLQDFNDWRQQGMTYAWLLRRNGLPARKCRFIALLKDHSKSKARFESGYPKSPVFVYEFDVTQQELERHGEWIAAKVAALEAAEKLADDEIEPCSAAERWASDDKYAVMKEGRKSAVRVLDTAEDANDLAERLGKGHYVEFRAGEPRKCADYCLCKNFCNFYKGLKNGKGNG
ncbi:MAG: PD-(D/E)XK nuclease family protein [Ruminiclostridium sp.]|nr:PD-(D/E)XK nuclease family protein [Ruminiclostridium sp.]